MTITHRNCMPLLLLLLSTSGIQAQPDNTLPAPEDDPVVCSGELMECPDGSSVGRVAPDCEFEECPEAACPSDIRECPDGSTVVRVLPDCEFEECPEIICPADIQQCPDGTEVVRIPPDCEFEECPEIICPADIQQCWDGTEVVRVPPECEFEECPESPPPTDSPTPAPTDSTPEPTKSPTKSPTVSPTEGTAEPSSTPTKQPSVSPTEPGTPEPSATPSAKPSRQPSASPSFHPSSQPSSSPSLAPTEKGESAKPSAAPSSAPSSAPSVSPAPTASPPPVNCSEYQHELQVPGLEGVTMHYVVNLNLNGTALNETLGNETLGDWFNNTDGNVTGFLNTTIFGTISIKIIYQGVGWLGFAVSPSGSMVGSDAVIGLPREGYYGNVSKYHLTFDGGAPGYQLLGEEQQTLMDTEIWQDGATTILEFTRFLYEEGEVAIDGMGYNDFLIAHGTTTGNELGYHGPDGRSAFNLTLSPCIPEEVEDFPDFVANITGDIMDEEMEEDAVDVLAERGAPETFDKGPSSESLESSGAQWQPHGVIALLSVMAGLVLA